MFDYTKITSFFSKSVHYVMDYIKSTTAYDVVCKLANFQGVCFPPLDTYEEDEQSSGI